MLVFTPTAGVWPIWQPDIVLLWRNILIHYDWRAGEAGLAYGCQTQIASSMKLLRLLFAKISWRNVGFGAFREGKVQHIFGMR